MSNRREHEQDLLRRVEHLFERVLCRLDEILQFVKPHKLTKSVANIFTGDFIMANNVLVLNVGQTATDTPTPLAADGVTPSGGTVSNVKYTFSDPSATVVLNADNLTATCTGVAASTAGAVTGTLSCTVTDTDGAVSQWNQQFTILVNAVVPPAQLTQSVANVFSTPA